MPIYEFECRKCCGRFEVLVLGRDDAAAVVCPECGSPRTRRLMSAFSGKIGNTSGGDSCGSCASSRCGPS